MPLIRRHPIFFTLVAIIVVAIAAEAWFVFAIQAQERVLEKQLNQKITEIERLQRQRPGPTDENLRRVRSDFAQNAEVLATMMRSLRVAGPDELEYFKTDEPKDSTDAYFKIVTFVDSMRANYTAAGILTRPEERFGFGSYAEKGPEAELVVPVYRQQRIVEYLLNALMAARPRALVSVQRENPRTGLPTPDKSAVATPPASRPVATFAGGGAGKVDSAAVSDFFVIDPQVSARTPGYVDTMAIRISFTGQTSSLRGFMNALSVPDIPLVVRSVEVEPARGEGAGGAQGRTADRNADGQGPPVDLAIVADNESRFTVTVELFEVKLRVPDVEGATPKP